MPVSADSSANTCVRLSYLAVMDIQGDGAEQFLQGQTSAQVSLADSQFAPLTCFCTSKGRMMANGQLIRLASDHIRMLLSASLVEPLMTHLQKFAPFYKVTLSAGEDITVLGANQPQAENMAQAFSMALPTTPWQQVSDGHQRSILAYPPGSDSAGYRWLFILPNTDIDKLSPRDHTGEWQLADIRRGLVWLDAEHQDKYLPQMINWEALGGISFKKGCYTGQEVVARAHFRGQVKKRLWRGSINSAETLSSGTGVKDDNDRSVGEIVTSCVNDNGASEFLAVINTKAIDNQLPMSINDHCVELASLPYEIERLDPEQLALTVSDQ
ncbi:MAG: YgfZ/GcvT domain-containing protein [Pseudomonadota bacterium]